MLVRGLIPAVSLSCLVCAAFHVADSHAPAAASAHERLTQPVAGSPREEGRATGFSGTWRAVSGFHWSLQHLIITQQGATVKMFFAEAPETVWFKEVEVSGRRLKGYWYTPCLHPSGEVVARFDEFELTLSPDGKQATGRGKYQWLGADCQTLEEEEFVPLAFERIK